MDELAHTNGPECGENAKRWQDVDELLDAGIDVITTVNVQHLESLNDVVESITGVAQRETVPDKVVRRADQIELVDMSPEALRRRMAHGNVYPAERIDAALTNYFRLGNLSALRELALLWVADRVDEGLATGTGHQHGIDSPWPARERIVVALTGGPEGDTLIRRGARIAGRGPAGATSWPSTWCEATASPRRTPQTLERSACSWRAWAEPSTPSSGTTSRARCSSSPGDQCQPAGDRYRADRSPASCALGPARPWCASPATSTCTW